MKALSDYRGATKRILDLQRADGSIPWVDAGVFDPWNHTESAMALALGGEIEAARRAFAYLAETQNKDGSWWADYGNAAPLDDDNAHMLNADKPQIRDTNYSAYIAAGVWHHMQLTEDRGFARDYWPVVEAAINFVLAWQTAEGDVRWAARDPHTEQDDALLTGNASIYKSLECAIRLADILGKPYDHWASARARIGAVIRHQPDRFDRTWASNARFSMDWYYPVLAGAIDGETARVRLQQKWEDFVAEGIGCRCVIEEPWATVAESCELALALLKHGDRRNAETLFAWQHACRDEDGAYWMGRQFAEDVFWPADKPSWTSAAVLLAGDALYGWTPASAFFTAPSLPEPAQVS